MKPLFQPRLVNGPFEDPVLYLDFLFERRALLFDLGNLRALPTRKLLRVSHAFVSHTHMDHFADFDWWLRLCLGRDLDLELFGPPGFSERVEHKLAAYTWNLVHKFDTNLTFRVTELHPGEQGRRAVFRLKGGFVREREETLPLPGGVLVDEPALRVRAAVLDHIVPCLGYAAEEKVHVNLWKNRLAELGLPVGPWLRDLKRAVLEERPDATPIPIVWREGGKTRETTLPLGDLKAQVVRLTPGQKVVYVVDAAVTADNARRIVELARDAQVLFIETPFMAADTALAADKAHLTTVAAGRMARDAGVKRLEPIHFSPRYGDREAALRAEVQAAFQGEPGQALPQPRPQARRHRGR